MRCKKMKIMSIYDGVETKYYEVTEEEQMTISKFLSLDAYFFEDALRDSCGIEIDFIDKIEVKKF